MHVRSLHRAVVVAAAAATAVGGALLSAPGATAAVAVTHAPVAHISSHSTLPNHHLTMATSTNWSGYALTGGHYTSVSASWTQPAVNCSVTPTGWSSFWVGLDGYNSNSVEQTGTEADCSSGVAKYSSWYEMYPKYPVNYSSTVMPGDHFNASVTTNGAGSFTLTLSDTTRGWTHTTSASYSGAALSSAEVIAEAPSSSSGVLPLSDFGTVNFSNSKANGVLFSSQSTLNRIDMVSGSTTKASTSSMSSGAFSVTWHHS
jgi:Peptidase A4 family